MRWLLVMLLTCSTAQAGIYSICGVPEGRSSLDFFKPDWQVKSVKAMPWHDEPQPWTVSDAEVLELLSRPNLEVYESVIWALDEPVTFVGKVFYSNGKQGIVAIAQHRVCLTEGEEKHRFFQWQEKVVNFFPKPNKQ